MDVLSQVGQNVLPEKKTAELIFNIQYMLVNSIHFSLSVVCLFCFVCFLLLYVPSQQLRIMGGRSVHITTLFPGQA